MKIDGIRFFPITIRGETQIYSVLDTGFVNWPTHTFAQAKELALAIATSPEESSRLIELTPEQATPLPLTSGQHRQRKPTEITYES